MLSTMILGEDKIGLCPVLRRPELCVSDVDECFIDWDCVGDLKCCSNKCYKVCTAPAPLVGKLEAPAGSVTSMSSNARKETTDSDYNNLAIRRGSEIAKREL